MCPEPGSTDVEVRAAVPLVRRVIVDHVSFVVADIAVSKRFYTAALEPLGFWVLYDRGGEVGYGADGLDDFGLNQLPAGDVASTAAHVAFVADSQAAVDAFYTAALAAGGSPRLAPGIRPEYSTSYYAAFVTDPDGNNVEAVHHG